MLLMNNRQEITDFLFNFHFANGKADQADGSHITCTCTRMKNKVIIMSLAFPVYEKKIRVLKLCKKTIKKKNPVWLVLNFLHNSVTITKLPYFSKIFSKVK